MEYLIYLLPAIVIGLVINWAFNRSGGFLGALRESLSVEAKSVIFGIIILAVVLVAWGLSGGGL